jgi:hypothetical protein
MDTLWQQAQALLAQASLQRFFDPRHYRSASNEMPYVNASGELKRIDRLVEFDNEVWVLDYKLGVSEDSARYRAQMLEYQAAMQSVYAGKTVRRAGVWGWSVERVSLARNKYRDLRPAEQLLEIGIECNEVFTESNYCRREPRIGNIVRGQLLRYAELTQHRPLATQRRHFHSGHSQERIHKSHCIFQGRWMNEYLRIGNQPQKAGNYHGHEIQARAVSASRNSFINTCIGYLMVRMIATRRSDQHVDIRRHRRRHPARLYC